MLMIATWRILTPGSSRFHGKPEVCVEHICHPICLDYMSNALLIRTSNGSSCNNPQTSISPHKNRLNLFRAQSSAGQSRVLGRRLQLHAGSQIHGISSSGPQDSLLDAGTQEAMSGKDLVEFQRPGMATLPNTNTQFPSGRRKSHDLTQSKGCETCSLPVWTHGIGSAAPAKPIEKDQRRTWKSNL